MNWNNMYDEFEVNAQLSDIYMCKYISAEEK